MTILYTVLAVVVALTLTITAVGAVARHRERGRRLHSVAWQTSQAQAHLQAATTRTMRQMLDVAQQATSQRHR